MKEFLFYQNHKNELATNARRCGGQSTRSSMSVSTTSSLYETTSQLSKSTRKSMTHLIEFSEETLKANFDDISKEYNNDFTSAGFPPKICSELVHQLSCGDNLKAEILDVGCGNGYVGQYLREIGY